MLGIVSVWMLVLAFVVPSPASAASAAEEASFISRVNSTRAALGLPALQPDVQLTNLARGWATSMRAGTCGEGNFICHASPISAGVTHPWEKLGENVGTGPDVASVMQAFINSPGHYANIIDPEFTHIGVGVVWDGNRMFTTHRFMKLQGAAPTTTTAAPTTTTTTAAPATTTTTAATTPTTQATTATTQATGAPASTNDGGSPDQPADQSTTAENDSASSTAPLAPGTARSQPPVVLEERVSVLIDAFISID